MYQNSNLFDGETDVFDNLALILVCIAGLAVGIVSVYFTKPTIIISISDFYGHIADLLSALLLASKTMNKILLFIIIAACFIVQIKINNGLFEGATQKAAEKATDEITKNM